MIQKCPRCKHKAHAADECEERIVDAAGDVDNCSCQRTNIILTDDFRSSLEKERQSDLYGLCNFFVQAHVYGRIGDILLVPDARLEGLIQDHIEKYYKPKTEKEMAKKPYVRTKWPTS